MTLMKHKQFLFLCLLVSGANSRCFVIPIESSSCFERSTHVIVSRALDFKCFFQSWIIMDHQICVVSMCCIPCFKQDMFLQYFDNWWVSRIHGSTSKQRNKQRRKEKRTKQTRPNKPNHTKQTKQPPPPKKKPGKTVKQTKCTENKHPTNKLGAFGVMKSIAGIQES